MSVACEKSSLVREACDVVAAASQEVAGMSADGLDSLLYDVDRLIAQAQALRVNVIGRIDATSAWRAIDPQGDTESFLRRQHTLDHQQAKADVRAADAFAEFPVIAQAAHSGSISRDKIDAIVAAGTRTAKRKDAFELAAPMFTKLAETTSPAVLRRTLNAWADQVDAESISRDEDAVHRERYLHVTQSRGGVKLDGFFGNEQGMKVLTAINGALSKHRVASGLAGRRSKRASEHGQHDFYQLETATSQQRADAFIDAIMTPVLDSDMLPECGAAPAHVSVLVPIDRLMNPTASVGGEVAAKRVASGSLTRFSASVAANNGPGEAIISAIGAQKLSCDSILQRFLVDESGVATNIGRKSRTVPSHIRKALIIRDGGCIFPHCDRPPGWTEAHHIQHWSKGGETSIQNLALLCSRHHHQIHADNIPIEFDGGGRPQIRLKHTFRE